MPAGWSAFGLGLVRLGDATIRADLWLHVCFGRVGRVAKPTCGVEGEDHLSPSSARCLRRMVYVRILCYVHTPAAAQTTSRTVLDLLAAQFQPRIRR